MHIEIEIDHLLIGSPNLAVGCDYAETLLGTCPQPGGRHQNVGTRNALLGLDAGIYIEIIAPDEQQSPNLPLSRFLSGLQVPSLLWWASRCDDIQRLGSTLTTMQVAHGGIEEWSRLRPDGTRLSWQMLMPTDAVPGPAMPFFIRWRDLQEHPSESLVVAGRLETLRAVHTEGSPDREVIELLTADRLIIEAGATPALCATVSTPGGAVEFRSPSTYVPAIGSIR